MAFLYDVGLGVRNWWDALQEKDRLARSANQADLEGVASGLSGAYDELAAGASLNPPPGSIEAPRGPVARPTLPTPPAVAAPAGITGPRPVVPPEMGGPPAARPQMEDVYSGASSSTGVRTGTAPGAEPKAPGRVSATINGRTYEYGGGQAGGAPRAGLGREEDEAMSRIPGDSLGMAAARRAARGGGGGGFSAIEGTPEQQFELEMEGLNRDVTRAGGRAGLARAEAFAKDPFAEERVKGEVARETARGRTEGSATSPANRQATIQNAQRELLQATSDYQRTRAALEARPDSPKKRQALAVLDMRFQIDSAPHRAALGIKSDEFTP